MSFERQGGATDGTAHPSTAAIAGHPLHPMLVPLPIGLLAAAAVSDLASVRTRDPFFARASRLLIAGGIATGLTAAPFGLVDFLTIRAARRHPEAWLHGIGNVTVLATSAVNLALRARPSRTVPPIGVTLSGVAAAMLLLTGWLGGELSYRHRIGVVRGSNASATADTAATIEAAGSDEVQAASGEPVAVMDGGGDRVDPALVAD